MKPQILLTGPSNSSVDEPAGRILKERFMDFDLHPYNPGILRLGVEASVDQGVLEVRVPRGAKQGAGKPTLNRPAAANHRAALGCWEHGCLRRVEAVQQP
jgi:hypothetical protein